MDKLIVDSKKVAEIKYKALQKLAANQDRPLSEASIEAKAVIEVINELYQLNEVSPQDPAVYKRRDNTTIEDIHDIHREMLEIEETDEEKAYGKGYMDGYDEGLYDGLYK